MLFTFWGTLLPEASSTGEWCHTHWKSHSPCPSTVCIPANLQYLVCEEFSTLHFKMRGTDKRAVGWIFSAFTVTLIKVSAAHTVLLYCLSLFGCIVTEMILLLLLWRSHLHVVIVDIVQSFLVTCFIWGQLLTFQYSQCSHTLHDVTHNNFFIVFFCVGKITDGGCELSMDITVRHHSLAGHQALN